MRHLIISFFLSCPICWKNTSAQSNVSVKYFGLTVHPFGDYSANLQPYKLDKNAYFVANFGGYASYERFVWIDMLSVKLKQGIFTDCSAGMMGVSHLGVQMNLLQKNKHKLSFGIGPTLIYRESWTRFSEYEESGFWHKYDSPRLGLIQYKMILYGCEFEYDYTISEKTDLSVGFTPGFPFAFTFSFGVKHWFDKNFKTRLKLVTPPERKESDKSITK
ncbi:MAG: hypothetical protein ACK4K0_04545 [Flavobacteriales bacterium]